MYFNILHHGFLVGVYQDNEALDNRFLILLILTKEKIYVYMLRNIDCLYIQPDAVSMHQLITLLS